MSVLISRPLGPAAALRPAAIASLLAAVLGFAPAVAAQDDSASILKAMADYVASQKTISLTFDADIEVITSDLQKIQFTHSGQVQLSRPDKLRARRTGGYADIDLVFDGKTLTVHGRDANVFAQLDAPGSVDQLIDRLRDDFSVAAPGADLLFSHPYEGLMDDVIDAKHIGIGVIDGVECEHLAFRNHETDWQIWVETGPRPIPRKYVITSKSLAGAPQYTLRIKDWRTDAPIAADAFVFKPPADAKKVDLASVPNIDDLPPGILTIGGK
jgi:hypothetical protein